MAYPLCFSVCVSTHWIVVLDLASDSFSFLEPASVLQHLDTVTGAPMCRGWHVLDRTLYQRELGAMGMCGASTSGVGEQVYVRVSSCPHSAGSLEADWRIPKLSLRFTWPSPRMLVSAAAALTRARQLTETGDLMSLLAYAQATKRMPPRDTRVRRIVARVLASVIWIQSFQTAKHECLSFSAALCHILRREGLPARLHIGMAVSPFFSHAWVQVGQAVVLERPELKGVLCLLFDGRLPQDAVHP